MIWRKRNAVKVDLDPPENRDPRIIASAYLTAFIISIISWFVFIMYAMAAVGMNL
jgi:hypothetical protein